jgi:hypothetical protein
MQNKTKTKLIASTITIIVICVVVFLLQTRVHAAIPLYGFGTGQGRTDTVNINDFHTSEWDRFTFNYDFVSGMVYRYELGNPTIFNGFMPVDVYSANIRRDAQVSFRPPSYGTFSGFIPTEPSNFLFPQPVSAAYWRAFELENPNVIPAFDTLLLGVNAQDIGNPINIHNVGDWGMMQSTSIGGTDITPNGANIMTGSFFDVGGTVFNQSGNASSIVTTPSANGFLTPTSIR